jgi:hypothetical protein
MVNSYPAASPPEKDAGTAAAAVLLPRENGQNGQGMQPKGLLNLRHCCPVCGKPYQLGEAVLALTSFCLGPGEADRMTANHVSSSDVILGHHDCVLPRLLTLVASVRPGRLMDDLMPG